MLGTAAARAQRVVDWIGTAAMSECETCEGAGVDMIDATSNHSHSSPGVPSSGGGGGLQSVNPADPKGRGEGGEEVLD